MPATARRRHAAPANLVCDVCKRTVTGPKVINSPTGFFIGLACGCPTGYTRESEYYMSRVVAMCALRGGAYGRAAR